MFSEDREALAVLVEEAIAGLEEQGQGVDLYAVQRWLAQQGVLFEEKELDEVFWRVYRGPQEVQ